MWRFALAAAVALAVCWAVVQPARAGVLIPASASAGPVPAFSGTGLNGSYYAVPNGFNTLRTMADADGVIAANSPTATFRATRLYYQPGLGDGSETIGDILGADAATLDPPSVANTRDSSVWRFDGYIAITPDLDIDRATPEIDVEFAIGSDDASRLRIGGVEVLLVAGPDPNDQRGVFSANDFRATASFEAAGLYPVEIVWWDWYGGIYLRWYSSIPGSPDADTPAGLAGIVPTGSLYPSLPLAAVPEPASVGLLAAGAAGLIGRRLRRRAG
ncbi:MAG: PEP-CTERM sorting domain-containing protein [Gemmataceae bacterium]|nr:PEP-CTERM sorting domain-containing protein [Gemmataceae bacterium]